MTKPPRLLGSRNADILGLLDAVIRGISLDNTQNKKLVSPQLIHTYYVVY